MLDHMVQKGLETSFFREKQFWEICVLRWISIEKRQKRHILAIFAELTIWKSEICWVLKIRRLSRQKSKKIHRFSTDTKVWKNSKNQNLDWNFITVWISIVSPRFFDRFTTLQMTPFFRFTVSKKKDGFFSTRLCLIRRWIW